MFRMAPLLLLQQGAMMLLLLLLVLVGQSEGLTEQQVDQMLEQQQNKVGLHTKPLLSS